MFDDISEAEERMSMHEYLAATGQREADGAEEKRPDGGIDAFQ